MPQPASPNSGRRLTGQVALVTGASRGLGRAAALELAAAGAHVVLTARSTRGHSTVPALPQTTIDDTADAIRAAGGQATPLKCDHTDPAQVEAVIRHLADIHGRLDLLINNAWGAHEGGAGAGGGAEVWDEPPGQLRNMLLAGAYGDYVTSLLALKYVMAAQRRGLILCTTWHTDEPPGWLPYEVSKAAKNRLVYALADKLRGRKIAVVGVAPGWMRTEIMLQHHTEQELAGQTETPHYAARGLVALAADPQVLRHTGRILDVGELADLYGVTDLDGTQPQWYRAYRRRKAGEG